MQVFWTGGLPWWSQLWLFVPVVMFLLPWLRVARVTGGIRLALLCLLLFALTGPRWNRGGEGIDITLEDLSTEWRLMADLYALAIQTDRARFGSLTFLAAGERIRLKGDYEYDGRQVFHFDDFRICRKRMQSVGFHSEFR